MCYFYYVIFRDTGSPSADFADKTTVNLFYVNKYTYFYFTYLNFYLTNKNLQFLCFDIKFIALKATPLLNHISALHPGQRCVALRTAFGTTELFITKTLFKTTRSNSHSRGYRIGPPVSICGNILNMFELWNRIGV